MFFSRISTKNNIFRIFPRPRFHIEKCGHLGRPDPDSTTPQPGSFPTQIALPLNLGRDDPGDRIPPERSCSESPQKDIVTGRICYGCELFFYERLNHEKGRKGHKLWPITSKLREKPGPGPNWPEGPELYVR